MEARAKVTSDFRGLLMIDSKLLLPDQQEQVALRRADAMWRDLGAELCVQCPS